HLEIRLKLFCAPRPRRFILRALRRRPVAGWEVRGNVISVKDGIQHVTLRDAHVLQKLPGRMGSAVRSFSTKLDGHVIDGGDQVGVRSVTIKDVEHMFHECVASCNGAHDSLLSLMRNSANPPGAKIALKLPADSIGL